MMKVIKCDFYRLFSGRMLYVVFAITILISSALSVMLNSDIRLGISIFGNLTAFKRIEDLVAIGTQYYKGLGFLLAIMLSVFIGQEYLWKTLGCKWTASQSRLKIHLSRTLLSCIVALSMYIAFQLTVIILSGEGAMLLSEQYLIMIVSGIFPYIALGAVFTMISTIAKNNVYAIIACLAYVLLSETIVSLLMNVASTIPFVEVLIKHSIYGMSQAVSTSMTIQDTLYLCVNAVATITISTIVGCLVFGRQEL